MKRLQEKIAGEITMAQDHGARIRKWRKSFSITQTELAREIGISPSVISDYEKGRRIPGVEFVREIVSSLLSIDLARGGKVVKRFTHPGEEGIISMREFSSSVSIDEFTEVIDAEIHYRPDKERELFGYTLIDSLKAIASMKSFDYLRIYGWSTERVLMFTGVEYGRSPMVAIRASPLTPAAVTYVRPRNIDELTMELARVEGIPLMVTDLDQSSIIERLGNL